MSLLEAPATADLVLLAVAVPLVVATLVSTLWSISLGMALGAGSVVASSPIGYALFYDPPIEH